MGELLGRRFHRLFGADERSVVIAMDHGTTDGAVMGFENPEKVLEQVIAGGADAILTSIGIARHFSKQLKDIGLMIRCDGATSPLLERPCHGRGPAIWFRGASCCSCSGSSGRYVPHGRRKRSRYCKNFLYRRRRKV